MRLDPNFLQNKHILFLLIGGRTHYFIILFTYWFSITTMKNAIEPTKKKRNCQSIPIFIGVVLVGRRDSYHSIQFNYSKANFARGGHLHSEATSWDFFGDTFVFRDTRTMATPIFWPITNSTIFCAGEVSSPLWVQILYTVHTRIIGDGSNRLCEHKLKCGKPPDKTMVSDWIFGKWRTKKTCVFCCFV